MSPLETKYHNDLANVVKEGEGLAAAQAPLPGRPEFSQIQDKRFLYRWYTSAEQILISAVGEDSPHYRQYKMLTGSGALEYADKVNSVVGVLESAMETLKNGYHQRQEFIIAAELFGSTLERARHLLDNNFFDSAAVLGRVILEDALKRLATKNSISLTTTDGKGKTSPKRASTLNQELWKHGAYNQFQWNLVDGYLTVGNSAAHPTGTTVTKQDATQLLDGVEKFLATYFT